MLISALITEYANNHILRLGRSESQFLLVRLRQLPDTESARRRPVTGKKSSPPFDGLTPELRPVRPVGGGVEPPKV